QSDVKVRADPQVMSSIRLEVATPDGPTLSAVSTSVDADGVAVFSDVTLPGPTASLTAIGEGTCGTAQDHVMVGVTSAPAIAVQVVHPAINCGTTTTPSSDIDPAVDGVQVGIHVRAPAGDHARLVQTNVQGMSDVDASTDVEVTLAPGANTFVATVADDDG